MKEQFRETDILCFECGKDFGIDCPGREPNESTRCQKCFKRFMKQLRKEQRDYALEHKKKN